MATQFAARAESKAGETSRRGLSEALTLAAMSLGYGVVQLDVTIVNVAVNSIGASFGGQVAGLQWVVSSYTIAFAAFILSAGALGDRIATGSLEGGVAYDELAARARAGGHWLAAHDAVNVVFI
ncbi:MAG TPA: hypothetical protein VKQ70_00090, partial [Caulobacteraceae bacterium]|nr:hypothetical protein [Caulobacteraceae bacterium]